VTNRAINDNFYSANTEDLLNYK